MRKIETSQQQLTLALVSAVVVPQLGMGMIVPALPELATSLRLSTSLAQDTLIVYMVGYAISVLLAGWLADRFGPRRVQIGGLILAVLGACLATQAHNILLLMVARFIQAVGGCAGTVTARLIVSREYVPQRRMPILTTLSSAIAITPCLAPLAGSALLPLVGWRGIFGMMALLTLMILVFFTFASRRLAAAPPNAVPLHRLGTIYRRNLRLPLFRLYALSICFAWMAWFVFVSCSSGPMQQQLGLTPQQYAALLSASAIGYVAGSMLARRMAIRRDIDLIIQWAAGIGALGGGLLVALNLMLTPTSLTLMAPMLIILLSVGMVIPATQAGLLRSVTEDTGASSGLFFFLQMMAGAAWAAISNLWQPMSVTLLAILIAIPALLLPFLFHRVHTRLRVEEKGLQG
ncbi:multidrug effflux MFS transporter [Pantoea sp. Acro-805]|uniref:Multidrug effflux MFS transporter n=1 Tax=Candidatus Pantoea formicae TaxID=2608355 RepID=A0ABX0QPR9_9GAMM|nr:MFS transporter [Erwiniaceae bacterium L1_54_3]NIE99073.1 multidrug effflux MFS transporter [Pantoea formicae]